MAFATNTAFAQQGSRVIVNGDLEFGRANSTVTQADTNFGFGATFDAGTGYTAPWFTTHPTQAGGCDAVSGVTGNCHPIEIWGNNFNPGNGAVPANSGSNLVELNAFTASMLYQNVCLQQNEQFAYSFAHRRRGQSGITTESVEFIFTNQSGTQIGSAVTTSNATGLQWFTRTGTATYGGTSGIQRLGFRATAPATGGAGNLLDSISITLAPLADLRGSAPVTAAEGASLGTVFIRLNGTVAASTTIAIQRTAPSTGTAAIDSDFTIAGPSTVTHTAGTDIWLVTVPAGQYDGGIVAGSGAGNPADGITLTVTAATDTILEPQEGFRMQILAAGSNGSSTNWLSGDPVCGGDQVQQTNDFFITGQSEIRVAKISNGSTGTFSYALTNADTDLVTAGNQTAASITTATAGTQTFYDANSSVAGIQGSAIVAPGTAVTITETIPSTWDLVSATCVDASSNPVAGTSLSGGVLTVPGTATGATASLTCTFTNSRQADLSIQKTNTPASGNNDQANDTVTAGGAGDGVEMGWSFVGSNVIVRKQSTGGTAIFPFTGTNGVPTTAFNLNTGTSNPISSATFAVTNHAANITITETATTGFQINATSCQDAGGNAVTSSLSGQTLTIAPAAYGGNQTITCTFTNGAVADLSIAKTNTPASGINDQANDAVSPGPTTYTITVTNNGSVPVSGPVVRDTPTAGLTCPGANAVSCSPAAACAGPYTVASLTSAGGITLGTLASSAAATLSFSCTVN